MKNRFVSSHPHLSLVKLEMNSFVPLLLLTLSIISNGLHLSHGKSQSTFQSYDNELTDQVCGRDTIPGKMPFYASIEADDPIRHYIITLCSGVLIANRWVLTPAHFIFSSFESIRVVLGDKWNNKTIGVESAHFLPDLGRKTPMNNIALLLLEEPVQFSRNIQPICLPEPGETFYGRYGTLAGWTERNPTERKLPSSMHTTSLPIIRSGDCRRFYDKPEFIDKNLTDSLFCAGYPKGPKDACPTLGDPLMVKVRKHWVIAGITVANMSCWRSHALDAYLRVGFFLDWIKSTIEKYNS